MIQEVEYAPPPYTPCRHVNQWHFYKKYCFLLVNSRLLEWSQKVGSEVAHIWFTPISGKINYP